MAIHNQWDVSNNSIVWNPNSSHYQEYAIQGIMCDSFLRMDELEYINLINGPDEIKKRLIGLLIQSAFKKNCIEFTRTQDINDGIHTFRSRMFVVPDNQVKIIRTLQK